MLAVATEPAGLQPDMTTASELEAQLKARRYDGRTVKYRGTAEINSAIADLERELSALQGRPPVRQIRFHTSKGP